MSSRQIIVLAIAGIAAIGAAFLVRGMTAQAPAVPVEAPPPTGAQVLVVTRNLPQGAALTASDIAWRSFTPESIGESFIKQVSTPNAQVDYVGAIARRAFAAGEPIVTGTVIQRGEQGILATQLPPGFRAIAIEIDDPTASGGFIQPGDRVDVILTTTREGDRDRGVDEVLSDVILENVRVLTVGPESRPTESEEGAKRINAETAVLELSQRDARTLALAEELGKLRLVLRGVETEPPQMDVPSAQHWRVEALEQGARDAPAVRVHGYGAVRGSR